MTERRVRLEARVGRAIRGGDAQREDRRALGAARLDEDAIEAGGERHRPPHALGIKSRYFVSSITSAPFQKTLIEPLVPAQNRSLPRLRAFQ